jgi:hypothetical protein
LSISVFFLRCSYDFNRDSIESVELSLDLRGRQCTWKGIGLREQAQPPPHSKMGPLRAYVSRVSFLSQPDLKGKLLAR